MNKYNWILVVICLSISTSWSQQESNKTNDVGWDTPRTPLNCEINYSYLELTANKLKDKVNENGVLIVIARLGKEEKNKVLNHRRLHNVQQSLVELLKVSKEKIVTAESSQAENFGRIEFYLNGKLFGVLLAKKNADICVRCCGRDERFYPEKQKMKF
jgi:hypothetical protein